MGGGGSCILLCWGLGCPFPGCVSCVLCRNWWRLASQGEHRAAAGAHCVARVGGASSIFSMDSRQGRGGPAGFPSILSGVGRRALAPFFLLYNPAAASLAAATLAQSHCERAGRGLTCQHSFCHVREAGVCGPQLSQPGSLVTMGP